MFLPIPHWLVPTPWAALSAEPSTQGTRAGRQGLTCSGGDAQEPTGVFQPRPEHLLLHGAGGEAGSQQGRQQKLWPERFQAVCVQREAAAASSGLVHAGALPSQTSPGHLSLAKV